jgi:hypothetical protein
MDPYESETHSFIVKIWLEKTAQKTGRAAWRGHITHVPGGERRYLKKIDDIAACIVPYLKTMGVDLGIRWRVRAWLFDRKRQLKEMQE